MTVGENPYERLAEVASSASRRAYLASSVRMRAGVRSRIAALLWDLHDVRSKCVARDEEAPFHEFLGALEGPIFMFDADNVVIAHAI